MQNGAYDDKKAAQLEKKMREQTFNLEAFLEQSRQIRQMGSMQQLLGMIPGINQAELANANIDERQLDRMEAIILSMTPGERQNPSVINASRRKRIAAGSGMKVEDVNRLLKQFDQMQQMMKRFSAPGAMKKMKRSGFKFPY